MDIRIKILHIIYFRFNYIIGKVSCLVCEDLNPDDLALDLMVSHEPDVVTQVSLTVKRLDPAAIVTHPILRVDTYSHSCLV